MSELISPELFIPLTGILAAAFMQSITGFGLAIIATPLLIITYEPKLVVVMLQFIAACSNIAFGVYLRKKADYKLVAYLTLGALVGQPLGLFIYDSVSNEKLKLLVSICIIIFLLLMKFFNAKIPETKRNSAAAGFLSGVLATTTGMSGPPLVMYLAYSKLEPSVIRATCTIYFGIVNITSLIGFAFTGEPLDVAAVNALHLLPALVLGLVLGNLAFKHVSSELFRRLIFAMLFISCAYTVYTLL